MWVPLTIPQHRATLSAVELDEATWSELQIDFQAPPYARKIFNAPYVAWKTAREALYKRSYGPRGGKLAHGRQANYSALTAIQKELNYFDSHPALKKLGMYGLHVEEFPVWKLDPTPRWPQIYTGYPQPGKEFVILKPKYNGSVTWWVESPLGEGRCGDEALHLSLRRHQFR